jgi:hypothetical protein
VRIIISAVDAGLISLALSDIQESYGDISVEGFSNNIMIVRLAVPTKYNKLEFQDIKYNVFYVFK